MISQSWTGCYVILFESLHGDKDKPSVVPAPHGLQALGAGAAAHYIFHYYQLESLSSAVRQMEITPQL